MSTIARITPLLARTVMAVGILTGLGSVLVAGFVGEPKLLLFTAIAALSSAYGREVATRDAAGVASPATGEASVQPMAA